MQDIYNLNEYIKKKKITVSPNNIKEQLILFLRCDIDNPAFDSQTKDYMNTPVAKFGSTCNISDKLIENLANADLPEKAHGSISKEAVGLGFGDVVILELLKDRNKLPSLEPSLDCYLIPFGESEVSYLLPILHQVRAKGYSAQIHYPPQKPRKMFTKADQLKARYTVIAGSQEREMGQIKLKNLQTGEEILVEKDLVIEKLY